MKLNLNPEEYLKPTVDDYLNAVDFLKLNSNGGYIPSEFALKFVNFIKLVNSDIGEDNETPVMHLTMLDKLTTKHKKIANLCARGTAKTTLFMEYLTLFLAMFNRLPNFGEVPGMLYISDSMDNGVKSARNSIEFRYNNSEFLQSWIPEETVRFTENYLEFTNRNNKKLGVKMFGAKALTLDTILYTPTGYTTIRGVQQGDTILGADGKPTIVISKSEIFNKPVYRLTFRDGRIIDTCEDHLNQLWKKEFTSPKTASIKSFDKITISTKDLLKEDLMYLDPKGSSRPKFFIESVQPLEFKINKDQLIDPYTVGLLIGDGCMGTKGSSTPVVLIGHKNDWEIYKKEIPYSLGKPYYQDNTIARTIKQISKLVIAHGLNTHGDFKKIPDEYMFASVDQRLQILRGLMDSDGTAFKNGKCSFTSNSKVLVEQVMWLVRSLGGYAYPVSLGNSRKAFRCNMELHENMFKLPRKLIRQKKPKTNKFPLVSIKRIKNQPTQCIQVDNKEHQFVAGTSIVRTHNSGIRGTKIFSKRPVLAIMDDLVSDSDSKSKVAMEAIKDTVYSGVQYALDPTRHKMILNGTPFNKEDIVYSAIESGAWQVNVWPICEKFPCSREEFHGAWEDRFSYDYVLEQYNSAELEGKLKNFRQELMLRISSEDDRLVQDSEILWESRIPILNNKHKYNFYITTDFATSSKQTADYSVISVWAYDESGKWIWVDGVCERQTMANTIDDLFRLVKEYSPQGVGIEITGQQQGFIDWITNEMVHREVFFNLTRHNNNVGIRPATDKLSRFNMIVPLFKLGKIAFPLELKATKVVKLFIEQIALVTKDGIKGKDDCLDTVSMLQYMSPWKPNSAPKQELNEQTTKENVTLWDLHGITNDTEQYNNYNSYTV